MFLKNIAQERLHNQYYNFFSFQLFSNNAGTKWFSKKEIKEVAQERLYDQYYASVAQPANKIIETFDSNEITEVIKGIIERKKSENFY